MLFEHPPSIARKIYFGAEWVKPCKVDKCVYLTFDDGPIPIVTNFVLETLKKYNVKATFFCVGDNVLKYNEIYNQIINEGHRVGNHTFNHLKGLVTNKKDYIENIEKAAMYIKSNLFRPPHGLMKLSQFNELKKHYRIIMWDVLTRDYNAKITNEDVLEYVKKYTRNGSIIVFHDSLKSFDNIKTSLPMSIEWLKKDGYSFNLL